MHAAPAVAPRTLHRAATAFLALALTAVLGACGPDAYAPGSAGGTGSAGSTGGTGGVQGGPGPGRVPAELLGEWQDPADLSLGKRSLDLYDPRSGWVADTDDARAGSGIRFTRDGGYVWSTYASVSNGGCWSHGITYQHGTVEQDGGTVVLEPQVNRRAYKGGCNSDSDMDREESHSPQRWSWARTSDAQGVAHLTLTSVEATHDYVLISAS